MSRCVFAANTPSACTEVSRSARADERICVSRLCQDIMARKGVTVPRLQGKEALSLWQEWVEQE